MLIQAYVLCSRVIEYADVRVLQSSQCARSTFAGFITRQITSPMVCGFLPALACCHAARGSG